MMIGHQEYWDDVPPLGREGRRWLRRRVYTTTQEWLRAKTKVDPEDLDAAPLIDALVCDLVAEPEELFTWVDEEHFLGRGYSSGHYVFKQDVVLRRLPELFAATAQRLDATEFPEMDDWLDALQRDVLYAPGPTEQSRAFLLERSGVRICRVCRAGFAPDRRTAVRCPRCRAGRKAPAKRRSV